MTIIVSYFMSTAPVCCHLSNVLMLRTEFIHEKRTVFLSVNVHCDILSHEDLGLGGQKSASKISFLHLGSSTVPFGKVLTVTRLDEALGYSMMANCWQIACVGPLLSRSVTTCPNASSFPCCSTRFLGKSKPLGA